MADQALGADSGRAGTGAGAGPSRQRTSDFDRKVDTHPISGRKTEETTNFTVDREDERTPSLNLPPSGTSYPHPHPEPLTASSTYSTNSTSNPTPTSSKSRLKRRPIPLVLGAMARAPGVDEERSAQLEANGMNSASSAIAIQTHDDGMSLPSLRLTSSLSSIHSLTGPLDC